MVVIGFKLSGEMVEVTTESSKIEISANDFIDWLSTTEYNGYIERSKNKGKLDKKHLFGKELDNAIISQYLCKYSI